MDFFDLQFLSFLFVKQNLILNLDAEHKALDARQQLRLNINT